MARTVNTTDERVLEAAKKYPKAEGMLREMFPDVFPTFKPGNIVDYKSGHSAGPFIVVVDQVGKAFEKMWGAAEKDAVHIVSLVDGNCYSPTAKYLYLVREKY